MKMKRVLCLFLSLLLIVLSLFGCGSNGAGGDSSRIQLTLDNYEQYLTVTAKYAPASYSTKTDVVSDITCSAEVTPASPTLKFYNCAVQVRIIGSYKSITTGKMGDKITTDETLTVQLNIGGSGQAAKVVASAGYDLVGKQYEVVSVSGYVSID